LRDGLDEPNVEASLSKETTASGNSASTLHSETAARLEQTLKVTMEERQKALQKIIELEKALNQAKEEAILAKQPVLPPTPQFKDLQKMLLISDTQGEQAALQWARAQVMGVPPLSNENLVSSPRPRLLDVVVVLPSPLALQLHNPSFYRQRIHKNR